MEEQTNKCVFCGSDIHGRIKKYCNDVCRQNAFRKRKENGEKPLVRTKQTKEERSILRKEYEKRNAQKIAKQKREYYLRYPELKREYDLKRKYGITLNEFNEIYKKQNGKCEICGNDIKIIAIKYEKKNVAHVDHNHKTKEIRGLLCGTCNWMIGYANENPEILINAAKYLEKYNQ
jgi:hypothetical protein